MTLIHVAIGGALGAMLRYLTTISVAFPYGTLAVNVVGSFAMGLAFVWLAARGAVGWQHFVMTGILGGFTTFSAFSLDTLRLVDAGRIGAAAGYAGASVVLSVAAIFAAVMFARGLLT